MIRCGCHLAHHRGRSPSPAITALSMAWHAPPFPTRSLLQIVSQAKQSLLEGWNSLAEPGEAPVQWELSLQDATSLLDMLTRW